MVGDLHGSGERRALFSDPKQTAGVRVRRSIEGCGDGSAIEPVMDRFYARTSRIFLFRRFL
jgi:hypothetical protein